MAEILLRVVDKINTDQALNELCSKAGDVIHVAPDGWGWGTSELTNTDWRIVKMPGVDPATLEDMLIPQEVEQNGVRSLTAKRAINYNLNHPNVQAIIDSGQVITLTPEQITFVLSLKTVKPQKQRVVIG